MHAYLLESSDDAQKAQRRNELVLTPSILLNKGVEVLKVSAVQGNGNAEDNKKHQQLSRSICRQLQFTG